MCDMFKLYIYPFIVICKFLKINYRRDDLMCKCVREREQGKMQVALKERSGHTCCQCAPLPLYSGVCDITIT